MLKKIILPQNWIILGIPVLFAGGTLIHFLYDITGKSAFVGAFAPVNESIWEHTKMVVLPILLCWGIYYLLHNKKYHLNKNKWFTSALISLLISIISIPMMFYFYTDAFGIESVVIDILILLVAFALGQILGLHVYRFSKGTNYLIPLIIFTCTIIIYIVFTFYPPHIPIFLDSVSKTYGIQNSF